MKSVTTKLDDKGTLCHVSEFYSPVVLLITLVLLLLMGKSSLPHKLFDKILAETNLLVVLLGQFQLGKDIFSAHYFALWVAI